MAVESTSFRRIEAFFAEKWRFWQCNQSPSTIEDRLQ